MAHITLDAQKLKFNYDYLSRNFKKYDIEWGVVTKLLCGNKTFIDEVISLGIKQVCDSRLSHLKMIKSIAPEIETAYIKPPAQRLAGKVVEFADISYNTSLSTIKALSEQARIQQKLHKVVIMIEMGELREGVLKDDLLNFYEEVFELPNIEVIGLGTNLTCMYGVLPNHDKLIQLCLYKQLIEIKFGRKIPFVSGGTSVTIPLIPLKQLPLGVNHFRIGETLFFGTDVYNSEPFPRMKQNVFMLYAEIIELYEKPDTPDGTMGNNLVGEKIEQPVMTKANHSFRAIIDLGLLDIDDRNLVPINKDYEVKGASSDMIVVDLGENPAGLKVGDYLEFEINYMATLRLMNSKYVDKMVVNKNIPVRKKERI